MEASSVPTSMHFNVKLFSFDEYTGYYENEFQSNAAMARLWLEYWIY